MRILQVTTFLRGGAGVFVTKLSKGLCRLGHEVDVISTTECEGISDWNMLRRELSDSGIAMYTMNFFKRDNSILWSEVSRLIKLLIEKKYDLIHVHSGVPALASFLAKRAAGLNIPILATFHSWGKERPEWMNIADIWAYNQCDKVMFVSEAYKRYIEECGVTTADRVIYPGLYITPEQYLDKKDYYKDRIISEHALPKDAHIVSQLGEITLRKGQIDLLESFAHVFGDNASSVLFFIGECKSPAYKQELTDMIRKYRLENRVFFTEWVEDPYIYVTASDLFVFPSYSEGLGSSIIESISLEVPTIFSSIEGTKDIENIIDEDTFGTFPPGDVNAIQKRMVEYMDMPRSNVQARTRRTAKRIQEQFNFKRTVLEYDLIIHQIASQITY